MSHLGNQLCHLIPQPSMSRVVIVGPMPEQRYRNLMQLHWKRAEGEPEFGREQPSQSRLHGDDDGARATRDGTVRKRGVVSTTVRRNPSFSSASSTIPRTLRPGLRLVNT